MIDTHAHLNSEPFIERIDEVVKESKLAGLTGIVVVSSNTEDSTKAVEFAQTYPNFLYASVGIHPQEVNPACDQELATLKQLITDYRSPITAVGECGLDYSAILLDDDKQTEKIQTKLFIGQIELAIKFNLPIIIHARKANEQVIEILSDYPNLRGVFHFYSGGKKRINKILDLGEWYFGIDGNITYEDGLPEIVREIPVDRILIETDTPFLAPIPFRGQENKPAYLIYIQKQINKIFGRDLTGQIDANSRKLFGI